jgi:hypothetical protein
MLSLSEQFSLASTDAQRAGLLAAGEAMLALSNGTGYYVSLILMSLASLLTSVVMLKSSSFSRITAYSGILAEVCDIGYCIALQFYPVLGIILVSAAGLFLTIWHILVGRKLYLLSREGDL